MKVYELVAATVLRVGQINGSMRPLSWPELGQVFGVTKDSMRHQLNRFKEKYNVVDSDVEKVGWNREFLLDHTPDAEKRELDGRSTLPGDVYEIGGVTVVCISPKGDARYLLDGVLKNKIIKSGDTALTFSSPSTKASATIEHTEHTEPLKFLITPTVLVVVRDGNPLTIDKSHKNFDRIQASLESGEWQNVLDFIDMKNALTKYSNGRVTVEDGVVTLDGENVNGRIVDRLVNSLLEENSEALEGLSNFLSKCDDNPDFRVVSRIYDFMAHNDLRLDKDGNILAYKVVKNDYMDKYSGTMLNKPGETVSMKRNKVNPKDEETCSHGLHVAAKKYIPSYGSPSMGADGDRVVLCRINPKDFVSIPTDYNSMKARVCEYQVVKDVTELFCQHQLDDDGLKV